MFVKWLIYLSLKSILLRLIRINWELNEMEEKLSRGLVPLDSVNGNLPVNGVERRTG